MNKVFTISINCKATFSVLYNHFDSFLLSTYKVCMIHTLLYRCFWICSDWTKFHLEIVELLDVLRNKGYLENFINKCLKHFLVRNTEFKKKMITVPKKPLILVLSCHGPLSLPTRTKLRKSFKVILNCCKLQIMFNNQLPNVLRFKYCIPKELAYFWYY